MRIAKDSTGVRWKSLSCREGLDSANVEVGVVDDGGDGGGGGGCGVGSLQVTIKTNLLAELKHQAPCWCWCYWLRWR